MSVQTDIQWTAWRNHEGVWLPGATWNIWRGCTEVHTGCVECYARDLIESRLAHLHRSIFKRCGIKDWDTCPLWGAKAPRVRASRAIRLLPLHLQKDYTQAVAAGKRPMDNPRVFLGSLMDLFDDCPAGICDPESNSMTTAVECLAEALQYIRLCPDVTFICVTKRPDSALKQIQEARRLKSSCHSGDEPFLFWVDEWLRGNPPSNVWFVASISDQPTANRIVLDVLRFPAVVRGLSIEPLVGPVDLDDIEVKMDVGEWHLSCLELDVDVEDDQELHGALINWVIVGGESGPKARPCNIRWIRAILKQCRIAGVKAFVKQLGAAAHDDGARGEFKKYNYRLTVDRKGGDVNEWPADLQVRGFPLTADRHG